MRVLLGAILSFIGPFAAGWLIVSSLWPQSARMFRSVLALVTGLGIAGSAYIAGLSVSNSATTALLTSEVTLVAVIMLLLVFRKPAATATPITRPRIGKCLLAAFLLTLAISAGAFFFILDYSRHGGWDAIAIWNLKAKFIFLSDAAPLDRIVEPALGDTQPDYPLLLPSLVARGWQYAGKYSTLLPSGISALFTIATFLITVTGIKRLRNATQACIAGCVLMGTPYFLVHGASQFADIVMCCFITATVVLFCVHENEKAPGLPILAGLLAGFGACVKNEGILFLMVIAIAHVLVFLWKRNVQQGLLDLVKYAIGTIPGVVALTLFKTLHSPANAIVGNVTLHVFFQRIQTSSYHAIIWQNFLKEFHDFGSWWIYPIPLLLIHLVVSRIGKPRQASNSAWMMPALVLLGMMGGYYLVYLMSPYDLQWHIGSSLARLVLQIWPTALVLYSVASAQAD